MNGLWFAAAIIIVSASIILLVSDWRKSLPALLLHFVGVTLLVAQLPFPEVNPNTHNLTSQTLVAVKLVTGLVVCMILAVTALTFSSDYGLEELDEIGLSELRRAARTAIRFRQSERAFQSAQVFFSIGALAITALLSISIPYMAPVVPAQSLDSARNLDIIWYWVGLSGIFTLVTATDSLKLGTGLLLCLSSADLLYTAVASTPESGGIGVVPLMLMHMLLIITALVVAYVSGLLYSRIHTLELGAMFHS